MKSRDFVKNAALTAIGAPLIAPIEALASPRALLGSAAHMRPENFNSYYITLIKITK